VYLARLLGLEGKKALQQVSDQIAAHDPETASAAQLQEMEASLDKAGLLLAKLRASASHEDGTLAEAKKTFDLNFAAGERLQAQLRAPDCTPERKEALTASLNRLLTALQDYKAEVDRDQASADDAHSLLTEAEAAYEEKAKQLKQAKGQLDGAKREQERSSIRLEQAKSQAEMAAQVAGLRSDETGGLNGALNALQRTSDRNNQAAEALKMKAKALRAPTAGEGDALLTEALTAVQNQSNDSSLSFEDRLAALKPSAPQLQLSAH
jgi:hypothetical protein